MTESKLHHAIFGTCMSWLLTWASWVDDNSSKFIGLFAVCASIATIWAAVETALWRRKQRKKGLE